MRYTWPTFAALAVIAVLPMFATHAGAQSPAEDTLRAQQSWQIQCMEKGCIASVDILRGASDDAPDPKDSNQYISIAVGVNRETLNPSLVMFEVDPHADPKTGIYMLFAHTVPDGKSWKLEKDPNGPVHYSFTKCAESSCMYVLGGGKTDDATLKSCRDLVERMRKEDHIFLLYSRNGHAYRTAVSLNLFREAYKNLLVQAASAPESPTKP